MHILRMFFVLLLLVGGAAGLLAQPCPVDAKFPYAFCKGNTIVYRCSSDPHHMWEDGKQLKPLRRSLPGCLTIELSQTLDIFMPTAGRGGVDPEYVPVFLAANQGGDITDGFNTWTGLCPPTDDHDCCVRIFFSPNPFDFDDAGSPKDQGAHCYYEVDPTTCRPTCAGHKRIYINASSEWLYQQDFPEPSDDLVNSFYTGRYAPAIAPGYRAISLYQTIIRMTGIWFGLRDGEDDPATEECSYPNTAMGSEMVEGDAFGLTDEDICQFRKLYCDKRVGLGVEDDEESETLSLSQNVPNPFTKMTTIHYSLSQAGDVKLVVFDGTGNEVKVLVDQRVEAGNYTFGFHGDDDMPAGTYWYVLRVDGEMVTRQMILIK